MPHTAQTPDEQTGSQAGLLLTRVSLALDRDTIDRYRSSGGFTMLASGRDKIETEAQFERAVATAKVRMVRVTFP